NPFGKDKAYAWAMFPSKPAYDNLEASPTYMPEQEMLKDFDTEDGFLFRVSSPEGEEVVLTDLFGVCGDRSEFGDILENFYSKYGREQVSFTRQRVKILKRDYPNAQITSHAV
ncbi:MAG: hypothetical protein ACPG5P_01145, partial [Saprospiraceae bacterium]